MTIGHIAFVISSLERGFVQWIAPPFVGRFRAEQSTAEKNLWECKQIRRMKKGPGIGPGMS